MERVVGRFRGASPGPVLIVVSAMHGNEPAGPEACRRVLERIEKDRAVFRGEIVFLIGNTRALEVGARFVEKDLNRVWTPEQVRALSRTTVTGTPVAEDLEQVELLRELDSVLASAAGPVFLLDLHTSSADGRPFLTVGDTLRNQAFARRFPLPKILGLEEQVDGSLLEYLNNRGLVTLGVEAGRHDAPESSEHLESVLWLALAATRQLASADAPDRSRRRKRLARAASGVPPVVEVRHRHPISPRDHFRMEPGFANFDPIERGQLLARDVRGEIRAPEAGLVLLPLYQGQGNDGFFLGREVRPVRLRASAALRRLGIGRLLPALPGVRRHPVRRQVLVVDTRLARWRSLEILRLLGYRKLRRQGALLLVSRRRYDLTPPDSY
jgi:succinylglutamate desuccinylase